MNRQALHLIGYGLYVVASIDGKFERINGQIANTVMQVASKPPTLAVAINRENLTCNYIRESRVFTASVLGTDTPMEFIGKFGFRSGRDINKFKGTEYRTGVTDAPVVLDYSLAYIEVKVTREVDVETHILFVGEVVDADLLGEGEPMTYAYYHQVKGGKTPDKAPAYTEDAVDVGDGKYRCTICGYIYDPRKGDPDHGVAPKTSFDDLPDDWVCPVCGAAKRLFEPVE